MKFSPPVSFLCAQRLWRVLDPGRGPVYCSVSYSHWYLISSPACSPLAPLIPAHWSTSSQHLSHTAARCCSLCRWLYLPVFTLIFFFSVSLVVFSLIYSLLCVFSLQPIYWRLPPTWRMQLPCIAARCTPSTTFQIKSRWPTPLSSILSPTWRSKCTTPPVWSRLRTTSEGTSRPNCLLR